MYGWIMGAEVTLDDPWEDIHVDTEFDLVDSRGMSVFPADVAVTPLGDELVSNRECRRNTKEMSGDLILYLLAEMQKA